MTKQRRPIMAAHTKTVEPTVVNGINVDDLFTLIDSVKQDAAKGKTNWRVTTPGRARRGAERKSRASRSAENGWRADSRSTSMNLANWAARTLSPIRKNICSSHSTPA
jgi:hypothetical protein